MPGDLCTAPRIISLSPFTLATDVTVATHGASGLWLRTRIGAGGTAAAYGSMENKPFYTKIPYFYFLHFFAIILKLLIKLYLKFSYLNTFPFIYRLLAHKTLHIFNTIHLLYVKILPLICTPCTSFLTKYYFPLNTAFNLLL